MRKVFKNNDIQDRVCFIHSCTLKTEIISTTASNINEVLHELLNKIITSSLIQELSFVFVFNYGTSLQNDTALSKILKLYPHIILIEGSDDTSRFEIPALRSLHYFAQKLVRGISETICTHISMNLHQIQLILMTVD
jgi:hypothetical protein